MRILFAVHGYKPAYRIGGPIISVSALAEELVRRGHRVTVVTSNGNLDEKLDVPTNRPVEVDGVEVWYFARETPLHRLAPLIPYLGRSIGFLYSRAMRPMLDRVVPSVDLVHTHLPFVYPTLAAATAAFRHDKPLFYHQRGVLDPARLRFRGVKKRLYIAAVERRLLRGATTLFALTEAERHSYAELGVQTPVRVIPNGVHADRYRTKPAAPVDTLLSCASDATVVLFMGRIHPIKGADKLLDAFVRVAARHPRAVLVMAGPDEWKLQLGFARAVGEAGLTNRVRFPGMVTGNEKLDLLARADLFCLPSDAEGFSIAVLEAMASSTAVLLSPGCHFAAAEAGGAGRIVPATVDALSAALDQLLTDPAALRAMGARGRQLVLERYTWERVTEETVDAYEEGMRRRAALRR